MFAIILGHLNKVCFFLFKVFFWCSFTLQNPSGLVMSDMRPKRCSCLSCMLSSEIWCPDRCYIMLRKTLIGLINPIWMNPYLYHGCIAITGGRQGDIESNGSVYTSVSQKVMPELGGNCGLRSSERFSNMHPISMPFISGSYFSKSVLVVPHLHWHNIGRFCASITPDSLVYLCIMLAYCLVAISSSIRLPLALYHNEMIRKTLGT